MTSLEQAKLKLNEYESNLFIFLMKVKENVINDGMLDEETHSNDDADCIKDYIYCGDIDLEWKDERELTNLEELISIQKTLVSVLETLESNDKNSLHKANKGLEQLVHNARKIRHEKNVEIVTAQKIISEMDDIIKICNTYRK